MRRPSAGDLRFAAMWCRDGFEGHPSGRDAHLIAALATVADFLEHRAEQLEREALVTEVVVRGGGDPGDKATRARARRILRERIGA